MATLRVFILGFSTLLKEKYLILNGWQPCKARFLNEIPWCSLLIQILVGTLKLTALLKRSKGVCDTM